MRSAILSALILGLAASSAFAADAPASAPRKDLTQTPSGAYDLDPAHTSIIWRTSHLGFSWLVGRFSNPTGTLMLDTAKPENSKLEVSIPTASIATASSELSGHLAQPDFFDAMKYPTIKFVSKRIIATGPSAGSVEGDLTLHGITKPVTLKTNLIGAGMNPFIKAVALGFHAETTIKRSEFGISAFTPAVGDAVELVIDTEFHQAKKD